MSKFNTPFTFFFSFGLALMLIQPITAFPADSTNTEVHFAPYTGFEVGEVNSVALWDQSVKDLFPRFIKGLLARQGANITTFKSLEIDWASVSSFDLDFGEYYENYHESSPPKDIQQMIMEKSSNPKFYNIGKPFTRNTHAAKQAVRMILKNENGKAIAELTGHERSISTAQPQFEIEKIYLPHSDKTLLIRDLKYGDKTPSIHSSWMFDGVALAFNGYNEIELTYYYYPFNCLVELFSSSKRRDVVGVSLIEGLRFANNNGGSAYDFEENRTLNDGPVNMNTRPEPGYSFENKEQQSCSSIL